jgi:hypothetical protein
VTVQETRFVGTVRSTYRWKVVARARFALVFRLQFRLQLSIHELFYGTVVVVLWQCYPPPPGFNPFLSFLRAQHNHGFIVHMNRVHYIHQSNRSFDPRSFGLVLKLPDIRLFWQCSIL